MWKNLSLRTRLFLPLGLMFAAALLLGAVALKIFATSQLLDENQSAARSARSVADALNAALRSSDDPGRTLQVFADALGTTEAIRFRQPDSVTAVHTPADVRSPIGRVPRWFIHLLTIPQIGAAFPVTIDGAKVGDIVFEPDLSADIFEKWVGFVAITSSGIVLMLIAGAIAHFTARGALEPLRKLGEGLTRLRAGDYAQLIEPSGPPELRQSTEEANELARTLRRLSQDNRGLLRRMVSLQDDERGDIARELHDELGPLLFGIRANTVVLLEALPPDQVEFASSARSILGSVEGLQQANRRILDRLRPLYIAELGLERSIQTLLQNTRAQAPALQLTSRIDPALNAVDGPLSQTVYRVIQEALTNVLRHAQASTVHVEARIGDDLLIVEIDDDGIGFPPDQVFGRGLTGMLERVRALSGTLELLRDGGWTRVRCRLPAEDPPDAGKTKRPEA